MSEEVKSLPEYSTVEEIRDNFTIAELVDKAKNENLSEWLASNFYLGQAQKVLDLVENDANDAEIFAILCRIFKIDMNALTDEEAAKISHSLETIRARLNNKAIVAECQADLARAVWGGADVIVLSGEDEFNIALGVPSKTYRGENNTLIEIFYDEDVNLDEKNIVIENAQIFLRSNINFTANNSKNIKVIRGNKKKLDGDDLTEVFKILKGKSPFESIDNYRQRAENVKGVAVGYALFKSADYNFDAQSFGFAPTWDLKFIDVLRDFVKGKKFTVKVAPDVAEKIYFNERKLQIFADFTFADNKLTIASLYLETANAGRVFIENWQ
jgi:hypothetical protein